MPPEQLDEESLEQPYSGNSVLGGFLPVMARNKVFMAFPEPQCEAVFLDRPQRFLAHMGFPDGSEHTVYCANPGSLKGCLHKGSPSIVWDSGDAQRKRRYTWRAIKLDKVWIGTDTHLANRLAERLVRQELLPFLAGYKLVSRDQAVKRGIRLDFFLERNGEPCFLEVKSATVVENGIARFPDSVTPRGLKHLQALTRIAKRGARAILLFVIQRSDARSFQLSTHYGAYTKAVRKALAAGVEIHACALEVTPAGFRRPRLVQVDLHPA